MAQISQCANLSKIRSTGNRKDFYLDERLEKSPGTKIIHSGALLYLSQPIAKPFQVLLRINMSNPVPNTRRRAEAFIEKSDTGGKKKN